jgi:hypothetical protein
MVPDDKLAVVLHGLDGIVKDTKVVVVQALVEAVTALPAPNPAKLSEPMHKILKELRGIFKHQSNRDNGFEVYIMRSAIKRAGLNPNSCSYWLDKFIDAKIIRRSGYNDYLLFKA